MSRCEGPALNTHVFRVGVRLAQSLGGMFAGRQLGDILRVFLLVPAGRAHGETNSASIQDKHFVDQSHPSLVNTRDIP